MVDAPIHETPAPSSEASPEGRERLIEAAIRLFGRLGFEGTSVRDLAEEAGVAFSLIRFYFGSKEGLRDAAEARVVATYLDLALSASADTTVEDYLARIEANLSEPLNIHDIAPFLRRALIEERPIAVGFVRRMLEREREGEGPYADLARRYPQEAWARDPVLSATPRLGVLLLAPLVQSLLGRDLYSREELLRRNAAGFRIRDLVAKGLATEAAEKKAR
jgi:AcrR family transcriptional regulator